MSFLRNQFRWNVGPFSGTVPRIPQESRWPLSRAWRIHVSQLGNSLLPAGASASCVLEFCFFVIELLEDSHDYESP